MSIFFVEKCSAKASLFFLKKKKFSVFGYKVVKHLTSSLSYRCFEQLGPDLKLRGLNDGNS